ncbi:efflux RND transporter permease subunit [Sulfurimonas sp.]|jgi:multidrug efflux pump subunit AcrB|uniref:efflux RND transporter permease subunit n=1 Tax=Sulfurimonas sp. TaxID=2022749 RepID=UPI0025F33389|nr:efflux RND transporter permease subunit [Sulfurimonas sp.]MCK9473862.1 efflux RND transporter permease subunit [Sulfurimonas sp.]MDD3506197.1 efflux RND transporter permease subunit [Sulfurimonas sp.]
MIRRFLEFAIDKPLLNHILLAFIFALSIFAYINIPKEIFPPMNMDKIAISGGYVGTSADVLDKMVVKTIEDDLQNISELDIIKTTIKNGSFSIIADIKPGSDNVNVLNDVKDIVSGVKKDLPSDMSEPIAKIQLHSFPLALVALAGDRPKEELLQRAEELKSELSKLKDLSDITIRGDAEEELVIKIDEQKVLAFGLQPALAVEALKNISSVFPIGTIKDRGSHLYISTYNGEKSKIDIESTVVNVGSLRVRIGDIADVSFKLSDETELSHYNGVRNVSINITKAKEGNAIELVKQVRVLLKESEKLHPELQYEIYTDTSIWIKNRLNTVFTNMTFGLMLVFLAMLIFINRGIAFVVAMGIPLSFMIGLIATEIMGDSLNMLSLLGALIALGMLVDEAIVVAENIYRHLEEGMDRREAAILGAQEMFPAVLAATLTTVFAFLPMLLLTGEMGMFIKIIPIMITVLLLSSLFEAFYFLPLHAHDFLKVSHSESSTKKIWKKLSSWHNRVLHFVFRKKWVSLIVMIVTILSLTTVMIKNSKFQLFPDFDTTQVYVYGKVNINNELEDTEMIVTELERELLKNIKGDDISSITSIIGFKLDAKNMAETGEHLFHIFIDLSERAADNVFDKYISPYLSIEYDKDILKRQRDARDIAKEVQRVIEPFRNLKENGNIVYEELVVKVPGAGVVASDIEISLSANDEQKALLGIKELEGALRTIEGVDNISNDATLGEKELKLRVNEYGQQLGFNEQYISTELRAYYLKGEYGKMFNENGLVRIKIESKIKEQINSIDRIEIQVPSSDTFVLLKDVCDFIMTQGFVALQKENGVRIRTVTASIDKDIATSAEVMSKLERTFSKLNSEGYKLEIKGEEKENAKNKRELMQSAFIAIFLIFITLVWLFDSIKKSLIVISTIPLVLLGVLFGHMVMGINITMPGMIGVVGLAGVVVNDGLIVVNFIKNARNTEQLMKQAQTRLRPILLTSLTTVLGISTLIFFASGQAMILQPMAVSLGFGVAWATVLNLIYVPLMYAVVFKIKDVEKSEKSKVS